MNVQRQLSLRSTALLLGSLVVVLVAADRLNAAGVPVWSLTQDPGPLIEDFHWNTGALSILGSMLWAGIVVVLALGSSVLRAGGDRSRTPAALVAFAAVAAMWAIDDTFLIHDLWLPSRGIDEKVTMLVYVAVTLAVGVVHRRVVLRTDITLLALVGLGFVVSTGMDALLHAGDRIEDIAKLWAVTVLFAWAWRTVADLIARRMAPVSSVARTISSVFEVVGADPERPSPTTTDGGAGREGTKVIS